MPASARAILESSLRGERGDIKVPESRTDIAILAAAATVISADGERNLTIDKVAELAGITRMTVFRRFGSREQLLLSTYTHELQKVIDSVSAAAETARNRIDLAEVIVHHLISQAEANPIAQRLVQVEPGAVVDLWRGTDFAGQSWGAGLISRMLQDERLDDPLDEDSADFAGDVLMRIVVSVLLVPQSSPDGLLRDRREYVRRLVEHVVPQ